MVEDSPAMKELSDIWFKVSQDGKFAFIGWLSGWTIHYSPEEKAVFTAFKGSKNVKLNIVSKEDLKAAIRIFDVTVGG